MPNQIIISMNQIYPFGQNQQPEKVNRQILVRKQMNTGNKQKILQKAKILKKLKVPHSIQIISILQSSQSLQIYYEYVPVKFQIWMKNISDQLSDNLHKQLNVLATFLANNKAQTIFNLQQLGFNEQFHIKYFLDLENIDFDQNFNPNQLKQKYYREIAILLKQCKHLANEQDRGSSFHSTKVIPSLQESISQRSSLKTMGRSPSLRTFQSRRRRQTNLTEGSDFDETENFRESKQSALNISYKQTLSDKLKIIKERMQILKQTQNNAKKLNQLSSSVLQFKNKNGSKECLIKKTCILKKSVKNQRSNRGISIDNLAKSSPNQNQILKIKYRNTLQCQNQHCNERLPYFKYQQKKNKSQKFRTPKNSESPIQYLDFMKSNEQYIQDFLNVLEEPLECEADSSFEEEKFKAQETADTDNNSKWIQKTQQSQSESKSEQQRWKARLSNALETSKKLIDKMKVNSKPVQMPIKV